MDDFFLEGLIQSTLSVSVLTLIIMLLQTWLKDKVQPRCFVWLYIIGTVRLLLIMPVKIPLSTTDGYAVDPIKSVGGSTALVVQQEGKLLPFQIESTDAGLKLILTFWIVGMLIFLVCSFTNYFFFKRHMILHGIAVGNLWDACIAHGIPAKEMFKKVNILLCDNTVSPMVIGYRSKYLCIPDRVWSKSDLEIIYRHEASHVRNYDLVWKLLFLIGNAMHWFNPFIYLMRSKADEYIELSCDAEAIEDLPDVRRKEYAEFLLYLLQEANLKRCSLATCTVERGRRLKNRFRFLLGKNKKSTVKGLSICFICIVLLIVGQIPAQCNILTDYFSHSYIEIWNKIGESQCARKIMLGDLYYKICESDDFRGKNVEQIDVRNKIILEPGNTLVLYSSANAEAFDLSAEDMVEVRLRINQKASLKIGLTNGSSHETTDSNPNTFLVQENDEKSLIYICNQTSRWVEIF